MTSPNNLSTIKEFAEEIRVSLKWDVSFKRSVMNLTTGYASGVVVIMYSSENNEEFIDSRFTIVAKTKTYCFVEHDVFLENEYIFGKEVINNKQSVKTFNGVEVSFFNGTSTSIPWTILRDTGIDDFSIVGFHDRKMNPFQKFVVVEKKP